jgi:hypothetical protein
MHTPAMMSLFSHVQSWLEVSVRGALTTHALLSSAHAAVQITSRCGYLNTTMIVSTRAHFINARTRRSRIMEKARCTKAV